MAHTHETLSEYFEYLDALRKTGVTNMYGAGAYITNKYGFNHQEAGKIVLAWMDTFSEEPASDRAHTAIARTTSRDS